MKYFIIVLLLLTGCEIGDKKNDMALIEAKVDNLENKINNLEQKLSTKPKLPQTKPTPACMYKVIKPTTFMTIKDTNVYQKPSENSNIISKWTKCTTFTSYKEKNGFVKVTGYFVNHKWVANDKEWWIKKCDIKVKKVFK